MKKAVVFSGAGLSKESGIPTFRDAQNGLWEQNKVEDVASTEGWARDQGVVLRFYEARMQNMGSCEPNAAHKAIARLQEKYKVISVTQNIDDLLERAGCKEVIHLHGDILHRKCEHHHTLTMLDGDQNYTCDYRATQTTAVKVGDMCPKCGGQLRPDIVWFGEPVIKMNMIDQLVPDTDVFIVVGTSAVVHPAASLLWMFKNSKELYFIDPVDSPRLHSYTRLIGPATEKLPPLVDELLAKA